MIVNFDLFQFKRRFYESEFITDSLKNILNGFRRFRKIFK